MMKDDIIRKTLFEKLFPYHVSQIKLLYGKDKCREYVKEAQEWLGSFIWLAGLSFLVVGFTVAGLFGLSSDTLSNLLMLSMLLVYYAYSLIPQLKDIRTMAFGDEYLIKKWMKATVTMICVSFASAAFNIFSIVSMLDFSSLEKESIRISQLGVEMTFPRRWSEVIIKQRPKSTDLRPVYRFKVYDDHQTMFFDLYGWMLPPDTDFDKAKPMFDGEARSYIDSTIISGPEIVECDSLITYRVAGMRKGSPEHVFILYQMLHQGSIISYSYRYEHQHCKYEKELATSEKMLKNIRFTDVAVPKHAGIPLDPSRAVRNDLPEDRRPDDYSLDNHSLDIRSAGIKISLPENTEPLFLKRCTRSVYEFEADLGEDFRVEFDVRVVWTSEVARLFEAEEDFRSYTYVMMDKDNGYISDPEIVRVGTMSFWKAVGTASLGRGDYVVACYETIHKGARLQICAEIPDDGTDYLSRIWQVESVMTNIDFY